MRVALLGAVVALAAACTPMMRDDFTRAAAKSAVRPVLVQYLPGVPAERAVGCVIDNATSEELLALASESVTGPTASATEIVGRIATRPATAECLATAGLGTLLDRL